MDKEVAGQPLWLWLTAAGVVVAGYLWFRHSQGSSAPQQQGAGPATSKSSFQEWITQHSAPSTTHKKHKKGGGD